MRMAMDGLKRLFCLCLLILCAHARVPEYEAFLEKLDSERVESSIQENAARGVLARLLPRHASSFEFRIVSKEACGGKSCFQIENHPSVGLHRGAPEIRILGTTGVELCAGLHWYLKYWCGAHLSWEKTGGAQLVTVPRPGSLPRVHDEGTMIQRPVEWNYYQNVVTSSYSYVWWRWAQWEKEIDWMALQGINLPLAFTGQESIWQKVFQASCQQCLGFPGLHTDLRHSLDASHCFSPLQLQNYFSEAFNLTKGELDDYFGGPAFLAWARMGNLKRWGGPLPQSWLDQQLKLQMQILLRMRELGMTPVLPAFSGNVPAAISNRYPSAKITRLGEWNTVDGDPRWCCTFLLDPTDPLFVEIGKAFILQQIKEYGGTQHIYNCDTFNENRPPTDDPFYISALGAVVYEAMSAGDQDAIWLMQGWLFASDDTFWKPPQMKALLHSVPLGKVVVLDLFADVAPVWSRSDHFYGIPYIWCMLHNFGGNVEMYGRLDVVGSGPIEAATSLNSTMVGVGMCMEGTEQNPVVYDLMAEMAFRNNYFHVETDGLFAEPSNANAECMECFRIESTETLKLDEVQEWVETYSTRRYGESTAGGRTAWKMLLGTIYNCSDGIADHNGDVIVDFPDQSPFVQLLTFTDYPLQKRLEESHGSSQSGTRQSLLGRPQHMWYSPQDAARALQYLLASADVLMNNKPYRYDVVDLTRQVLSKLANQLYTQIIQDFQRHEVAKVDRASRLLLDLLSDMDVLLGSSEEFLLGPWLESAKVLATTDEEKKLYEWNARTQITMWFDNTPEKPSPLHDYANKMWSGLIRDYYLPRASIYIKYLQEALHHNTSFRFQDWRREWIGLTNLWQAASNLYPTVPRGDTLHICANIFEKYGDLLVNCNTS